jgi:hypothetical protein
VTDTVSNFCSSFLFVSVLLIALLPTKVSLMMMDLLLWFVLLH